MTMRGSQSRLRVAFGTFVSVDAASDDPRIAERGLAAAFQAIGTVEERMHPTRAGSDLCRLAQAAPGECVSVHPWTWQLLELCARLNSSSAGVFDPCLRAAPGRIRDLELSAGTEVRARVPVAIDLGGIAKGFAVDRAVEALESAGCEAGMVNAGGDLRVFGADSRPIVVREPNGSAILELTNAALATSEVNADARPPEHRGHYHGASGLGAAGGCVTVVAREAAIADALTKCLLFLDERAALELLARFDAHRLSPQNASPNPRSSRLKSVLYWNH
jgi:FAD:protein FMN transferase